MQPLGDGLFAKDLEILLIKLCEEHDISPVPNLTWSKRMKKTLGLAYIGRNSIKLSSWLNKEQAQSTLRHELAHIATGTTRNHRPHGPKWRQWAAALGAPLARSSAQGPANAPHKTGSSVAWGLECPNCGLRVARMRVRKGLYHRGCGSKKGRLVQMVKASSDRVDAWVVQAMIQKNRYVLHDDILR